jgi:hypothetical protein
MAAMAAMAAWGEDVDEVPAVVVQGLNVSPWIWIRPRDPRGERSTAGDV